MEISDKFAIVTSDQIDLDDRRYIFTYEPLISPMITSIKNVGLLNPPILEKTRANKYRIVTGLKRILALKHLNMNKFQAKIAHIQRDEESLRLFLINLYENITTRPLNKIEKAIILDKLTNQFCIDKEYVIKSYLPLLGLGQNPEVLRRYLQLVKLEDYLKIALIEDTISIDMALKMFKMTPTARRKIFQLFSDLNFGKNRQKEFINLIQDISKIQNQSIDSILQHPDIQKIIKDESLTSPVKINRIKQLLLKMRYPKFTAIEHDFENIKRELKLPPTISLHEPAFFETNKYRLELVFQSNQEFGEQLARLNEIYNKAQIKKLEDLI